MTRENSPDDSVNKRSMKRRYLVYYLRVFNRKTGEVLGHLVDITEGGVMLMRESPLETGVMYSMRLRWRNASGRLQVIDFEGECRWCRPDINPDFYDAGFFMAPGDEETLRTIRQLIGDLGMPD